MIQDALGQIGVRIVALNALSNVIRDHGHHFPRVSLGTFGAMVSCPTQDDLESVTAVLAHLAPAGSVTVEDDQTVWDFGGGVTFVAFRPVEMTDEDWAQFVEMTELDPQSEMRDAAAEAFDAF